MDALTALLSRNSASKLCEPAPTQPQLEQILQAAIRAPDHAWLRPWRFLLIEGPGRDRLGELFAAAMLQSNPDTGEQVLQKARRKPLRAPLLVVVIATLQEHPDVPHIEQRLSAGCAAQNILLASHAMGYGGIWRTGSMAYDKTVMQGLGLGEDEEIIGFIYLGSLEGKPKALPDIEWWEFSERWSDDG